MTRKTDPSTTCGRVFTEDTSKVCGRNPGHLGLHNAMDGTQPWWGDNECLTVSPECG